jgi:hypothetical protein
MAAAAAAAVQAKLKVAEAGEKARRWGGRLWEKRRIEL